MSNTCIITEINQAIAKITFKIIRIENKITSIVKNSSLASKYIPRYIVKPEISMDYFSIVFRIKVA